MASNTSVAIRFCGVPGFCQFSALNACATIPLHTCPSCNYSFAIAHLVTAILLALAIFLGNGLIQWSVLFGRKGTRSSFDVIRFSLSISDMFMGVSLCATLIPNLCLSLRSTIQQLDTFTNAMSDTALARSLGALFLLSYTNSMYHLMVISAYRLVATSWPLWTRAVGNKCIIVVVCCAWIFALASATSAVFFNSHIFFSYIQSSFIFMPALRAVENAVHSGETIFLGLTCLIVPYAGMTILFFMTLVVLHYKMRKSENLLKRGARSSKKSYKREAEIIKTIGFMYIGFTISTLPFCVVVMLEYRNFLSCSAVGAPLMVVTLIACSNSLVNVLVTSFRDKPFQRSIYRLFMMIRQRLTGSSEREVRVGNSAATSAV